MKLSVSLVGTIFILGGLAAREALEPDKVAADITTEALEDVLKNLNQIAEDNGGNRAFGTSGYKASVDFILERVADRFPDDVETFVQPFNHTYEETREIWVKGPDGEKVHAITLVYNPATPKEGVTAPLIDTPVDDENGSACTEEAWEGIDATDKIALVKRGVCEISAKLKLARTHGALGVILYNQEPGTNYSTASLGAENREQVVPSAIIPLEVGNQWRESLADGKEVSVTLLVDSVHEQRETWNIIAETKEGDPDNVVFLGAHLDSVPAGPGVNDDGSGTAGLLVILENLIKYTGIKNKVRFGWWGAEELGLIGSLFYTGELSGEEADKIRYYFNYDMIGSPNPGYIIYEGEETGTKKLFDYLEAAGMPAEYGSFGTSSDYVGFLNLGIPSSGIFTGAGDPYDTCYHQACDDISNIHWDAITVNTKAAAYVAVEFALSLEGVPARNGSATPVRRGEAELLSWDSVMASVRAARPCSHEHEHENIY